MDRSDALPPPISSTQPASRQPSDLPSRRVLIVDDTRVAALTLARLLEALRQNVKVAHSGAEALQILSEERPDLLISDISMPEIDGYELARRIRSDADCHSLILVALTGYGEAEDRRLALEAGFSHHLLKPVSLQALQQLLSDLPADGDGVAGGPAQSG